LKTGKTYCILVIIAFLFGIACHKKPLPEIEPAQPAFYLDANINGSHYYLGAGEQNYYMNSSYYHDTNQVYVLKADLRQTACSQDCGYSIAILINDKKVCTANDPIVVNDVLHVGDYIFNDLDLPSLFFKAELVPDRSQASGGSYRWNIDGDQIETYSVSTILETGKYFQPILSFDDAEGICSAQHAALYKVGSALQSKIEFKKEGAPELLMYSFSAINSGRAPFRFVWNFGDGTSESTSDHPFHAYSTQGFYTTMLTVIDANSDTCISYYQVPAFVDPRCDANFTTVFSPLPNTKAFSTITILLTHPDGRVFSSKNLNQSSESVFNILEISDFHENTNQEPTKKIKIRFNCQVKNGLDVIKIEDAEAVLAVSYK